MIEQTRTFEDTGDGGYGWLELVEKRPGWRVVSAWGRSGWDLGSWPLVCVALRDEPTPAYAVYCEGDVTRSTFATIAERDAAVDAEARYWWRQEDAEWLTDGTPAEDLRGPFSWRRLNRTTCSRCGGRLTEAEAAFLDDTDWLEHDGRDGTRHMVTRP